MNTWTGPYSYSEATTACGAVIKIQGKPEDLSTIRDAICKAKSITTSPSVNSVSHGGMGLYTRYNIKQFEYGGGNDEYGGGYIEVLHIIDAPEGRCPYVLHQYMYWGPGFSSHTFSEWKTLSAAKKARKACADTEEKCKGMNEFIRFVDCGPLTPWFYAVGMEPLINDVAVHCGFEEHSTYRLGRRFLISEQKGKTYVATCMGAQRYSYQDDYGSFCEQKVDKFYWVIMFSDGSHLHLDESDNIVSQSVFNLQKRTIHPLPEGEIWQTDLVLQFMKILSGEALSGSIKLEDGGTINVCYKPKGKKAPDVPGKYFVSATSRDGVVHRGNIDFNPENDYNATTVVEFALRRSEEKTPSNPFVKVEVIRRLSDITKKWLGVWYKLTRATQPTL